MGPETRSDCPMFCMNWPDLRAACFAMALLATLPAAAQPQKCEYSRVTEVPMWVEGGRPVIEGAINGQKVTILIDTGAGQSFVHRSAVTRLGLITQEAAGYRSFGVGGESAAQAVLIDEFQFGHSVRKNWRTLVTGEDRRA